MGKNKKSLKAFLGFDSQMNQTGQAIVEYIIMLLVAVSIVAVISSSFRASISGLWSYYTQQVSAACPTGCPVNTSYRIR